MKIAIVCGIVLALLITFVSCRSTYQQRRDSKLVDQLTDKAAKKIEKESGLRLIGTGARMMTDIKMLAMSFVFYQEVDQQKARELLLFATREYLTVINENEELQPYLHNRPFTADNLEIMIAFYKPSRHDVSPGKINLASADEGTVTYYIREPQTNRLTPISTETYAEALKAANP